jgi:type I restriction enzyme S subunit
MDKAENVPFSTLSLEDIARKRAGAIKIGPFGSQLKKEDLSDEGFKVYGQENVITGDFTSGDRYVNNRKFSALKSCELFPGDLIVSMMGTIGKSAIFPADVPRGIMDSHLLRVQIDNHIADSKFIVKLMASDDIVGRQFTKLSHGSIMSGLSSGIVKKILLPIPPLSAQRRIAEILDATDEAIQKTEALIEKLKAMKQGLLHDLLTRGQDENGKLRDPKTHPEQFKDSPLGKVPLSWEICQLGGLSEFITSGSRGWASYYSDQGAMFLRIANLTRDHVNMRFSDVQYVSPPSRASEGKRTKVREGDLLISITADLGIIGVIPPQFGEAYVNQHIALVRLDRNLANPYWIGNYLAFGPSQKQFLRLNDQGAKAGMNLPTVATVMVAKPSVAEQGRIAAMIDAHEARIHAEQQYLNKLRLQKKGVMHDLLTGKVRVGVPMEERRC